MNQIDIVFSFDTTGSMASVIKSVRDNLSGTIDRLFTEVKGINIGLISHGDYGDYFQNGQFFWSQEPTNNAEVLKKFIIDAPDTNGFDMDECYEYVLYTANQMKWKSPIRLLVVIGDAEPHKKGYPLKTEIIGVPSTCIKRRGEGEDNEEHSLDICWKQEALRLRDKSVIVFGCDCSSDRDRVWSPRKTIRKVEPVNFYSEICRMTNGYHFKFEDASKQSFPHYLVAICMKAKDGAEGLELLQQEREQLQKELNKLEDNEPGFVQKREVLAREMEELEVLTPQKSANASISSFSSEVQSSVKKIREKRGMSSRLEQYQHELAQEKKVDNTTRSFVNSLDQWSTQ
jgi:hypothetical protein